MMRVVHIITGLGTGGAEMMLFKMLEVQDRTRFQARVISLTDKGVLGPRIEALGVPVKALGMARGAPTPWHVLKLAGWLRQAGPDLVQTWMYHADLVGGLATRLSGPPPIVWGLHHSNLEPAVNKRMTLLTARACAGLSHRLPAKVVCCSEATRAAHAAIGYDAAKLVVIPNGFDTSRFRPDPEAGKALRLELGLPADALLIGQIGRFDPQKDHRNLVEAAAWVHRTHPRARFVLCGDGITWENLELAGWIDQAGLREVFHLLGRRDDMPRVNAALDLVANSSRGEGFPNVIGEAMASGVPCVVTDVGDCALMVGQTGRVAPSRDPGALGAALNAMIALGPEGRRALGQAARARVEQEYGLGAVVGRYEALYRSLVPGQG